MQGAGNMGGLKEGSVWRVFGGEGGERRLE